MHRDPSLGTLEWKKECFKKFPISKSQNFRNISIVFIEFPETYGNWKFCFRNWKFPISTVKSL